MNRTERERERESKYADNRFKMRHSTPLFETDINRHACDKHGINDDDDDENDHEDVSKNEITQMIEKNHNFFGVFANENTKSSEKVLCSVNTMVKQNTKMTHRNKGER